MSCVQLFDKQILTFSLTASTLCRLSSRQHRETSSRAISSLRRASRVAGEATRRPSGSRKVTRDLILRRRLHRANVTRDNILLRSTP